MRKYCLAAVPFLIAAAGAQAQQSVQVYGRIDLALRKITDEPTKMLNASGSRLGFRGSEDLGGGLKALFQIEHRFDADTGTNPNARFWHGRSVLGLSGGFGEVVLGRDYTATHRLRSSFHPFGTDYVPNHNGGDLSDAGIGSSRVDNAILYTSPSFGGVKGRATYALSERQGRKGSTSFSLEYQSGGLHTGIGFEDPSDEDAEYWVAGVAYQLGGWTLSGAVAQGNTAAFTSAASAPGRVLGSHRNRAYLLGLNYRVGAGEVKVSYERLSDRTASESLSNSFGVGYHHALSRRTTAYVNANRSSVLSTTGFEVGLRHNF